MIFVIFSLIATVSSSVFTDNLITINPTADSIIKHQGSYDKSLSKTKSFPYPTLAFVTPWNNHGYDIAKQVKKFTLVSPVWFNIKPDYTIQGQHDVDIAWIKDVKQGGAKIVPRFQLDQFRNDDFMNLIKSHQDQDILANEIYNIVDANEFDGIVLEVHLPKYLIDLIKKVALKLRKNKKIIVLVIGPVRDEKNDFTRIDFNILESSVDYFALMTYDYSSPSSPGPNSPLHWVEKSITQLTNSHFNKLLVGLNFYGNDFGDQGGAIVGKQFIELLKHHEPELIWDDDNGEHYFEYGQGGNMVYYPTLYSIQQRLEMMTEKGCGLMIWEIGDVFLTLSKINHDLNKMTAAETEDIIGFVFCPPGWDESRLTSGEDSAMITTIANETYTDIAFIKEKNAIQIIGETHDDVYKAQNRLNSLFFPVAQKSKRAWTRPDKPGAWGQSRRSSTNLRRMASVSHMGEQEPSSNYRASGSWN